MFAEAVAAIDGPVSSRTEWNHRVIAAIGANDGIHLPGGVLIHASTLLGPPHGAATATAFGLVGKTTGIKEFLLARGEDELTSALHTD